MSDARDGLASIRWWPKDWRASTARATLSPLARGVYLDLLFAQFLEPGCELPADNRRLAGLAGVTAEVWAEVRDEVLEWIPLTADGKHRQNARMAHEWRSALAYREAQRESGRRGGRASAKARSTEPQGSPKRASTGAQASVNLPTPFRSDSVPTPKEEATPPLPPQGGDGAPLEPPDVRKALAEFMGTRRKAMASGYPLRVTPAWSHPRIADTVAALGGWETVTRDDETPGVLRGQFSRLYAPTTNGKHRTRRHA